MSTTAVGNELSRGQRLAQLLAHMGIRRAHFATRSALNVSELARLNPELFASLVLVCPAQLDAAPLARLDSGILCVHGDRGIGAAADHSHFHGLPLVTPYLLQEHLDASWSDSAAERPDELTHLIVDFLAGIEGKEPLPAVRPEKSEGEVAGITYRVIGAGPPLIVMPLGLAPSQWGPVLPALSARWCTILLGGAELMPVAQLEERARSGYSDMVLHLLDSAGLSEGQTVLEVGCGSGALVRRLAAKAAGANDITALDINPFLLGEAEALARGEGLAGSIAFKSGNAEELPFEDGSFDITYSSTVMEEVDANRVLDEMVRVTKPGGRVVGVVRAVDRPAWLHLPVAPELLAKIERQKGGGVGERGCADATLYARFAKAGLEDVQPHPQIVAVHFTHPWARSLEPIILGALDPDEREAWSAAVARAEDQGDAPWIARPFHCATGTKPVV